MADFLMNLSSWPIMPVLFITAVVLILIDYFFPVDYPAYIGYLCFAGGMFFALPFTILPSLLFAFAIWIALLILHRVLFSRFLTNAQDRAY